MNNFLKLKIKRLPIAFYRESTKLILDKIGNEDKYIFREGSACNTDSTYKARIKDPDLVPIYTREEYDYYKSKNPKQI